MLLPASTGTGLAELVTDRSAESATCTLTEALLLPRFGSLVVLVTEAISVIVEPEATVLFTFSTKLKLAVVFAAIVVVSVQVRLARTHVHPAGPVSDTAAVGAPGIGLVHTGGFDGAWKRLA